MDPSAGGDGVWGRRWRGGGGGGGEERMEEDMTATTTVDCLLLNPQTVSASLGPKMRDSEMQDCTTEPEVKKKIVSRGPIDETNACSLSFRLPPPFRWWCI